MAKSQYGYVRLFESDDSLLPNCWIVVRIDGKGFHKFSKAHDFEKPNDANALQLMNRAAQAVMEELRDIVLAFGESSFVLKKSCNLYKRRESKIVTTIVSIFTSNYVMRWSQYIPDTPLKYAPSFDVRAVLYPSDSNLRHYLSWRQADTHINNLYNTWFWNLVLLGGLTEQKAEEELSGAKSADKNELLFSRFGVNYSQLPAMFRKGTILMWKEIEEPEEALTSTKVATTADISDPSLFAETTPCSRKEESGSDRQLKFTPKKRAARKRIVPPYEDLIGDGFWEKNADLLQGN